MSLFNIKIKYRVDFPVVLMFLATALDMISTFIAINLGMGEETNTVLTNLINISIWFIPIYWFFCLAFVPFLSDILRKSFSYYFTITGFLLGLNNFSLIFFDHAFILDNMSRSLFKGLMALVAMLIFTYFIIKNKLNKKERLFFALKLLAFIIFLNFINGIFILINYLFT